MKRRGNGEGTIIKLANGKRQAQIYIEGKRPTRTFNTQKEAQVWLTEIKDAHNKGRYIHPSLQPFGEYWEKWIKIDKAVSVGQASRDTYAASRARLPVELFERPISRITRQDIQQVLNGMQKSRIIADKTFVACRRRTIELTRIHLNMCFEKAVEDRLIAENPVRKTV